MSEGITVLAEVTDQDKSVLRELGHQIAAIATLPIHAEKAFLWSRLNRLESVRPMLWIDEIPWHEMNVDDELTLHCTGQWARKLETNFRHTLYKWKHMPGDMVVGDYFASPLAVSSTGYGITEQADVTGPDDPGAVVSHRFHCQIAHPKDIEKIKMPVVTHDREASQAMFDFMRDLLEDILPVQQEGIRHIWYTPWDHLIRFWGVEQAMMDMVMRPQMVHDAVSRFAAACLHELDQYEKLNVLTLNNRNIRIGSGGYGYTDELPGEPFDPDHIRPSNMWGCSNAQIFSSVSPEMHWEFAIKHDVPWLQRWGLTYYGCCEPLDQKMTILRRIPNLRKVSMSPWIDIDRAVENVRDEYVFSYKPNPAILAEDNWRPERVSQAVRSVLDKTRDCHIEIILKDISTVRHQPQRLWEWHDIVRRCLDEFQK